MHLAKYGGLFQEKEKASNWWLNIGDCRFNPWSVNSKDQATTSVIIRPQRKISQKSEHLTLPTWGVLEDLEPWDLWEVILGGDSKFRESVKLRHGLPGQLSPQWAEFQWPEPDSTFPKLGSQPRSRQWVGEFHYVPLRLLFKMANESRFLELTVGLAWRRKTVGRKVSGVGKVMVNSLFFFFFFTGKTGGD